MTVLSIFKDKGDGADAEPGAQEEDGFIQDEIYKSRLASIKRVSSFVMSCCSFDCYNILILNVEFACMTYLSYHKFMNSV